MELKTVDTQWTDERIIDLVRKLRNDLIKDFLDERHLKDYVDQQFRVRDLSPVKIEFIKKDLKELMISPVNLEHYGPLINQIRLTDSAALTEVNDKLFYKEVEGVVKRYLYH
ncbi:MAG TPA: hypothetical protein VGD40_13175 [Chryseosolibacter sp.]